MGEELKKCPFCGSNDVLIVKAIDFRQTRIACNNTKGGCGASTDYFDTKEQAIAAWNRRA